MTEELLTLNFEIDNQANVFHKKSWAIFEYLGILGGIVYFTFNLVLFLISPLQKHSFILRAIKRLYFARTADNFMFYEKPEENYSETSLNSELNHEISKHKIPRLSVISWIELFFGCSNIKMKKLY